MKVSLMAETVLNMKWFRDHDEGKPIDRETNMTANYLNSGASDLEILAYKAGKMCVGKIHDMLPEDKKIRGFLNANVNKLHHESLLEHWQCTFVVEDVSRALTHQLVRHRHASFSQMSQRYTEVLSKFNPEKNVVVPDAIKEIPQARLIFLETLKTCKQAVGDLRELGIKREDTRAISPQAHKTSIVVSFNARSLQDFFRLRLWGKGVQSEIKQMAEKMYELVKHNGNFFDKEQA